MSGTTESDTVYECACAPTSTLMMQRDMVDSPKRVEEVIDWCRENGVAQLTIRPIRAPQDIDPKGEEVDSYFKYVATVAAIS